jgi:hypothetical protein
MKRCVFALSLNFLVTMTWAEEVAYGKLFLGTVDAFREQQDTQYGFEYQFANGISRYDFKPFIGTLRTRESSHYLYTGLSRLSKFTHSETGFALSLSLGPGIYMHGGGEDTDLGSPFEFRSSIGLLWMFADGTRIGAHFAHISNASIEELNPGTELITITYELPFLMSLPKNKRIFQTE